MKTPPRVSGVRLVSPPANSDYITGAVITVTVDFNQAVTVTGNPRLALTIGTFTQQASKSSQTSTALTFTHTVQSSDSGGLAIAATALTLNGGTIRDADANDAVLGLGTHVVDNDPPYTANDSSPSFGTATVESKLYDTGTAITPIALPAATGGNGALTYSISPTTLPAGLTWTASTRTIAGTPTTATATTTYTYRATDADGDAVTLTFSLRVWAPRGPAIEGTSVRLEHVNGRTKVNYWPGDEIMFLVQYPEKVTVTGTPQVTLVVGNRKRKANYDATATAYLRRATDNDPHDILIFTYTVRSDDFDGDGIAVPVDALSLNGGTILAVDDGANAKLSLGTHAIANGDATSRQMRVQDTSPSFTQNASAANRSLAPNMQTSSTLPLATGGDGALTYSVSPALPSGLSLERATPTITGTPTVSGTTTHTLTVRDVDGDEATLGPFTVIVAAGDAPRPRGLMIPVSPTFDGDYATGEIISVIIAFNRPVTVTGAPQLALTIGENTRQATHTPLTTDDAIMFGYTVQTSDFDGDGISIGAAALTLNGGSIHGADRKAAALDLSAYAITNATGRTVNDMSPSFGSATVAAKNYPAATAVAEYLPVATGGNGNRRYSLTPSLPAGLSFDAAQRRIHGTPTTRTATATYTYTATDGDGDATSLTFSLAVTTAPAVSAVSVSSSPGSGDSYGALETISVDVQFDQEVTVTAPNPSLALTIGTVTRSAAFASKPNASTLRFGYQVQAADDDDDGIGVAAGALTLNGTGKLRDATNTRDANLALGSHAIATATGHKVDTPPIISGVTISSSPGANGTYDAGEAIEVRLAFTEQVIVHNNPPTVTLTIGAHTRTATWTTGTPQHTFSYTVQSSDFDGDGISIAADAVTANTGFSTYFVPGTFPRRALVGLGTHAIANDPDHTVRDTKPTFGRLEAQHFIAGTAVDFTLPTATGGDGTVTHTLSPSTLPGGLSYSATTRKITGTPTAQAVGPARAYTWTATDGDGDATPLAFAITVAAANAPNVTAVTFLSAPGPGANNFYFVNPRKPIAVGIEFTPLVTVTGTPQLALTIGGTTRQATYVGSPTSTIPYHTFQYFVQASDADNDGITIGSGALTLNGGTIRDASNVAAALGLGSHAITNDPSHKVDGSGNALPVITRVNIISNPQSGDAYGDGEFINVSVWFSELVTASAAPKLALTIGTSTREATAYTIDGDTAPIVNGQRTIFRFSYTVTKADYDADGISIAAGALTLPSGATLRDAANADAILGLGSQAIANSAGHKVSSPPKVTAVSISSTPQQANTYTRGGMITARVTLDQSVTVTGSPELALAIGTYTRQATASASSTPAASLDFTYTVVAEDADTDGISIAADALTLPSAATIRGVDTEDAVLDLGTHILTNVTTAQVDGSKQGQWPDFGSATGPNLALTVGTPALYNLPASPTGDAPLAYTTSPSLPSGLRLGRGAVVVNGRLRQTVVLSGTPQNASPQIRYALIATDANGDRDTLPFTLKVSGESPAVTGLSLAQTPLRDGTYARSEEIAVYVRFDKTVKVTGTPQLALTIGSSTRQAAYASVVGSSVVFRYTVQASDRDSDGISIGANALTLNGGTIRNRGGTHNAVLGLGIYALGNQSAHKVDGSVTRAFQVSGVRLVSRPQNTTTNEYSLGEVIRVQVRFNQGAAVNGSPRLALTIGSYTRQATYRGMVPGSGTAMAFEYAVQASDRDADGLSIGTSALTLPSGVTIRNAQGEDAQIGLGTFALGNQSGHKVNGSVNHPAVITGVSFTSSPSRGTSYNIGATITVQVTFSKAVVVGRRTYTRNNNGFPFLNLTIGNATRRAINKAPREYLADPPSTTHTFRYTVVEGDYDSDGIGIAANALDLNGGRGTVRSGGVDANINLGSHAISAAIGHKVDGRRPTVTGVRFTGHPHANGEYIIGETVYVAVSFSDKVKFSGTPQLALSIGTYTRQAWVPGSQNVASGRNALGFMYPVQPGDADTDGISIAAGALSGSIVGAANDNAAALGLGSHAITNSSAHKVDGSESRLPGVTRVSISAPQYNNSFDVHEYIDAHVHFSVPVNVSGSPQLALTIGTYKRQLTYRGRTGTHTIFRYTVQSSDRDTDGISIADNALTLNGGSIRAAATNGNARLSVGNRTFSYLVDGSVNHPALIQSIFFVSSPRQRQTYGNGERIQLQVWFGKLVSASSVVNLAMNIGGQTRYASGALNHGTQHSFVYTVQSPDLDTDGISIPANPLTGGTIRDLGGQDASRTFGGLGNQAGHKVDYRVESIPVFRGAVVPALRWTVREPVRYRLPAALGEGTLTYSMPTSPPAGLTFTPSTRTIAGTPTAVTPQAQYQLTATDSDNDSGSLRFTIEIVEDSVPTFDSTFPAQLYVENVPISPAVALPVAMGGNGELTYGLSGPGTSTTSLTLPAGVTYTQPTGTTNGGTIAGTPTTAATAQTYKLTVTDAEGDAASLTFTIEVQADAIPAFNPNTWTAQNYIQNTPIGTVTLPAAMGGNGALTYGLSGPGTATNLTLPAGLTYQQSRNAAEGGALIGTPTVAAAQATYTLKATDIDGDAATLTFTVAVAADLTPSFSATVDDQSWIKDVLITAFTLPAATGGNGALTYALSPELPSGVVRDAATHEVSGTPTAAKALTTYTWTATDGDGDATTLTFTISVDALPSFGDAAIADHNWIKDVQIDSFALPEATGGDGSLTYTLSPALPTGVIRNATTRVVSGTPTATSAETEYTWTATDRDGDTASLTFDVTVADKAIATLVLTPSTIDESGTTTSATVTAKLDKASGAATTITVTATPVVPAVATDFTLSNAATLTIAAGQTTSTGTVTIAAVDNEVDAPDKAVTVSGTSGNAAVTAPSDVTLTIADDDAAPAVTLAVADGAIAEDGGVTTVTATLSRASSAATTVTVTAVTGSYTVGADATIEIAAGETSNTADSVTITAVNDDIDNVGNRSATVSGTAANDHGIGSVTGAALTLTDDEATPTATLVLTPSTIDERGTTTSATVTATLDHASSEALTLTVSAAGDFTLSNATTLTIAAGETTSTGTVTIAAVDNNQDEPDKSVTVSATASGTSGVADPSDVTLTIQDDEGLPTVSLVLSPSSISEDGGVTTVTAKLSGTSSAATTITVSATPVAPAVASDFTLSNTTTLTIAAGQTTSSGTVTISAVNNNKDDPNKSVTVSGSASGGLGVSAPSDETLTITDDEGAPTVSLILSPSSISEDGGVATVTAKLSGTSSAATTITVSATASTHAVASDFTLSNTTTLTIAAGSTTSSGTVTITANDNNQDEPNKSVTVSGSASGGLGVSDPSDATLTITDDEGLPTVSLTLSSSSISEDGGVTTVTAKLSGVSSAATTITVSATAGTHAANGDFTLSNATTLTIAAGQTTSSGTVTITAVNNNKDEPNKSVTVSGSASGGLGVSDPSNATLAITDDEGTPTVSLILSPTSISEDGGVTTVTAKLSGTSSAATTITVSATASTNAVAGDFTLSNTTTLTIAAGSTTSSGTVTITAVNNNKDEPNKSVTVSGSASGGLGVSDPSNATLTITDDEGLPTVSLTLSPSSISEDGGVTTVTAKLSGTSSAETTITVTATPVAPAVAGDFTLSNTTTLTIAAGSTTSSGTVTITANDNNKDEPNKSVTVSGSASGGLGVADPSNATLTITDDEGTPTVSLILSPASISEDGGVTTVTAKLSGTSSAATTITVSASASTNAANSDFTLSTDKTLTIAAGSTTSSGTVTITAVNNNQDEPNKSVTVSGSASGGLGVADPSNATLTITDDEGTPTVSLILSPASISEDGGVL